MRRLATLSLVILTIAAQAAAQTAGPRLDPRIPPTDRAKYEAGWAKKWANPRLFVDTEGVYLLVDGKPIKRGAKPVTDVAAALARLPVRQWPHGRIVALSPSGRLKADAAIEEHLERVREAVRALGVEIIETPVGCDCT
jgi:hypothetical protein